MEELHVEPWKRHGLDRLHVSLPNGADVAWLDRRTGRIEILSDGHRDAALDTLAPYVAARPRPGPPAAVPDLLFLHPDDDLAPNRPGELLLSKLAGAPYSPWHMLSARLLRRPYEAGEWHRSLAGQRLVGAELDRLTDGDWRAVHSIALPGGADIDHLLIGPGGVFCVGSEHLAGARARVAHESVTVGRRSYPYVRRGRYAAERASLALSRGCGTRVDVTPVLVLVGAARITVARSVRDVRVLRDAETATLGQSGGVLKPAAVEAIHTTARNRRTWRDC